MTLVRVNKPVSYDPFFNNVWVRNFNPSFDNSCEHNEVNYRLSEDENNYRLEFSVPGYNKEDIVLNIENDVLKVEAKFEEETYWKKNFSKEFRLSRKVNQDDISASHENGILSIMLPKAEEAKKRPAREISIN